jgi:hypothetical protein
MGLLAHMVQKLAGRYWTGMGPGPTLDQQWVDQSLTEMGLATFKNHSGPARWDRDATTTIPDPYRPTIKPQM